MYILGVHIGHDASAALLKDGKIIADVQEERFTRVKHYAGFPIKSISYCLDYAGITSEDLQVVAFSSEKRRLGQELLFPNLDFPKDSSKKKLKNFLFPENKNVALPNYIHPFKTSNTELELVNHHEAHASSAYFTSGRPKDEKVLVFCLDGMGERYSCSIWLGQEGKLNLLKGYGTEGSLGWFYSNVTEALDWWHGDGEGTLMGLAPYGDYNNCKGIFSGKHPVYENGELVNPYNFSKLYHLETGGTRHHHMEESIIFKAFRKEVKDEDLAAEAQRVLEEEVKKIIFPWLEREGTTSIACAGGVFLNVKLNQRLWQSGKLTHQHIFPNAGDSGLAVGAALRAYFRINPKADLVKIDHLFKGPEYSDEEIESLLKNRGIRYTKSENVIAEMAKELADDKIVAWFQGRMESGPRSLGNRSILMSANKSKNKDVINAKVKFRQAFRPFCPSLLAESADVYLSNYRSEEYMITSFDVTQDKKDKVPAVVHADGTLRAQMVYKNANPKFYELIREFEKLTGEALLLNTSLNIKGEPMICTPREAIRCFYDNGLDILALGSLIIKKDIITNKSDFSFKEQIGSEN
jgi:carbamoyltransferase